MRRSGGNEGPLFGDRRVPLVACRDLPEIAVRIREVAEVTPRCALRRLGDVAAGALGFSQHRVDALLSTDDVREREAAKPLPSAATPASSASASRANSPSVDEPLLRLKLTHSPCSCWIGQPSPLL